MIHGTPPTSIASKIVADGGVVHPGRRTSFADHAFAEFGALLLGQARVLADLFDRHVTPECAVDGTPDGAHRAAPEGEISS